MLRHQRHAVVDHHQPVLPYLPRYAEFEERRQKREQQLGRDRVVVQPVPFESGAFERLCQFVIALDVLRPPLRIPRFVLTHGVVNRRFEQHVEVTVARGDGFVVGDVVFDDVHVLRFVRHVQRGFPSEKQGVVVGVEQDVGLYHPHRVSVGEAEVRFQDVVNRVAGEGVGPVRHVEPFAERVVVVIQSVESVGDDLVGVDSQRSVRRNGVIRLEILVPFDDDEVGVRHHLLFNELDGIVLQRELELECVHGVLLQLELVSAGATELVTQVGVVLIVESEVFQTVALLDAHVDRRARHHHVCEIVHVVQCDGVFGIEVGLHVVQFVHGLVHVVERARYEIVHHRVFRLLLRDEEVAALLHGGVAHVDQPVSIHRGAEEIPYVHAQYRGGVYEVRLVRHLLEVVGRRGVAVLLLKHVRRIESLDEDLDHILRDVGFEKDQHRNPEQQRVDGGVADVGVHRENRPPDRSDRVDRVLYVDLLRLLLQEDVQGGGPVVVPPDVEVVGDDLLPGTRVVKQVPENVLVGVSGLQRIAYRDDVHVHGGVWSENELEVILEATVRQTLWRLVGQRGRGVSECGERDVLRQHLVQIAVDALVEGDHVLIEREGAL